MNKRDILKTYGMVYETSAPIAVLIETLYDSVYRMMDHTVRGIEEERVVEHNE